MATIATVDLKSIHETYKKIEKEYSQYGERFSDLLTSCLQLDPEIDLDIALKLQPSDGLIGTDNSALDKYFKSFKILRLHAMLYDASGSVYEYSETGPGYSYVLPCSVTNEYLSYKGVPQASCDRNCFLFIIKIRQI